MNTKIIPLQAYHSHKFSFLGSLAALVMDSPGGLRSQIFVVSMAPSPLISLQVLTQKLQPLLMTSVTWILKLKGIHLEHILAADSLFHRYFCIS